MLHAIPGLGQDFLAVWEDWRLMVEIMTWGEEHLWETPFMDLMSVSQGCDDDDDRDDDGVVMVVKLCWYNGDGGNDNDDVEKWWNSF